MINFYFFEQQSSLLQVIDTIANITIALFTLAFSIYIYYFTTKKDDKEKQKDRKSDSLKTIILEHNLKHLFFFYEKVITIMLPLSKKKHSDNEKESINNELQNSLKQLRLQFTDLFLAVDKQLYADIKRCTDQLIDELTVKMFDEETNLEIESTYDEEVTSSISKSKTDTVGHLYEFNN